MKTPVIGFCGMTHLGLNSAVAATEKGVEAVCFDPDADVVARLRRGDPPVLEPDLDRLLGDNADRLAFTSDLRQLERCDVVYVAPDVATDDHGRSDLSRLESLLERCEPAVRDDAALVILSQAPPGFTRAYGRGAKPLYYQVETLIFGRAIARALHPERYIVGCADPRQPLPDAYRTFLERHDCPILTMRYESAELAKIAINCCLAASICAANTLAELCEEIGADWSEIAPALRLDRRIGRYAYLNPGLGIAGGNLERDLATVRRLGAENGTDAGVVAAWLANSRHRKLWCADAARAALAGIEAPTVALLGLAYKENTHSVKNAPSVATLDALAHMTARAYDPVVKAIPPTAAAVVHCDSAEAALKGADAAIVITPWEEFGRLEPRRVADLMRGRVVIDPHHMLDAAQCRAAGLAHLALGAPRAQD